MERANPFSLSRSEIDEMFRQAAQSDLAMLPGAYMNPVLFVGYERDYFQGANGIRVTVDRELAFRDLTDEQGTGPRRVHHDSRLVFEFKFTPDQKIQGVEVMSSLPFSATRNTKYILGLSHVGKTAYFWRT